MTQIYNPEPRVPESDQDNHRMLRFRLGTAATTLRRLGEHEKVEAITEAIKILGATPERS